MYESPIELIHQNVYQGLVKKQDQEIYEAIYKVGVNVDREELIQALQYDRQQYSKGYSEGVKEFAEKLKQGLPTWLHPYIDVVKNEMAGEE